MSHGTQQWQKPLLYQLKKNWVGEREINSIFGAVLDYFLLSRTAPNKKNIAVQRKNIIFSFKDECFHLVGGGEVRRGLLAWET